MGRSEVAVIEVVPLSRNDARRLIDSCLDRARILLPDRQDFATGVIKRAGGNPRPITRLCEMAGAPRYQIGGRTNLRLLWIDVKISNLEVGNQRMRGGERTREMTSPAVSCSDL